MARCNQSLETWELLIASSEFVTPLNDSCDVIQPNIHAQVTEYWLIASRIDVVAAGQPGLEQRRKEATEFGLPQQRSGM